MEFSKWDFLKGQMYSGKPKIDELKTAIAQEAARLLNAQGRLQAEGRQAASVVKNAAVPIWNTFFGAFKSCLMASVV